MCQLANHSKVDANSTDTCPVHGGEVKKEYDFGMMDASVFVYQGCGCAVGYDCERAFYTGARYFTNYNNAAGYARLVVAGNAAR